MAQLVERRVRNAKVRGSNPLISTSQNLKRTTFDRVNVLGFLFCVDILDCNLLSINRSISLSHFDEILKHGGLRSFKNSANFGKLKPFIRHSKAIRIFSVRLRLSKNVFAKEI